MYRFGVTIAWVLVTGVFTFAAWKVVGAADSQVADNPSAPVIRPNSESGLDTPVTSTTDGSALLAAVGETTTTIDDSGGTGTVDSTTTTVARRTTTTSQTTSTTQPAPVPNLHTIPTSGGTVTVSYGDRSVAFAGATPSVGWSVEVKKEGPEDVEVIFRNGTTRIRVEAEMQQGSLQVEVKVESEEED